MNRRNWIQAVGVAAGAGLVTSRLRGALQCGPPLAPWGVQACVAGIPEDRSNVIFAYQQASEWCWAACIQMVFSYWGHPIQQQEIVRQTWGVITNMPAQPEQIVQDLNREWKDSRGKRFTSAGDCFSASGVTTAQDLAGDMPLIIGSMGPGSTSHAMVLTAVSYKRAQNGQGQVTGAQVRDPWPGNGGRRPLTPQEAASTMLLARIRVSST
jgi:Papain-like cysteine protease AvrRpt2